MMVNSTFVIHEVVIDFKRDCYWTILHQLYPHQYLITCSIETSNVIVPSPKLPWARLLVARGVSAFIRETLFVDQSKVLSVFADEVRKSLHRKTNKCVKEFYHFNEKLSITGKALLMSSPSLSSLLLLSPLERNNALGVYTHFSGLLSDPILSYSITFIPQGFSHNP